MKFRHMEALRQANAIPDPEERFKAILEIWHEAECDSVIEVITALHDPEIKAIADSMPSKIIKH